MQPTATQHENDLAAQGQTVVNKTADGSPPDRNTPPWNQATPANLTLPSISGPSPPTVGSVLACSPGTWSYDGLRYTYQWKRGGTLIAGATASTYQVVTADKTNTLTCTVVATGNGSASANAPATLAVP